jgi:hypothetical protein
VEAVGILPPAGGQNNCPVLSVVHGDSGPDRAEFGTIVSSVMVDPDKSGAKIDEKWKKAREKMIGVLFMEGANKGIQATVERLGK